MTEKFTWPADMPRSERAKHSKVIDPGGEHHGKPALVIATLGRRSLDGRFSWVLNSMYGPYGWSAPITHRHSETGKTVALSGLISRKGYVRIIREDIGAVAWDGLHTELKAVAKKVLHGRDAAIFERRVINPLLDPVGSPRPSVPDLALRFGISEKRLYKIINRCWRRIEAEHQRQEQEQEAKRAMNGVLASFAMKRQTGGITYQHDGRFWDDSQLARTTNYSTSINSAATAVSSSNTTYKDATTNE